MSAPALTLDELKALAPCPVGYCRAVNLLGGSRKWGDRKINATDARAAGVTLSDLLWVAAAVAQQDKDVERRLRLWVADCAARVLRIYERTGKSQAPRKSIIVARRFARGEIDAARVARAAARAAAAAAARAAAGDGAKAAAKAAALAAAWAAGAAGAAARDAGAAARDAAWAVAWATGAAGDAAWAVAWATGAAGAAAWDTVRVARDTEEVWQFDRLIAWLSAEEPEDWPLPARVEP